MSIITLFKHIKKFFLLLFIFLSLTLYPSIYGAFSSDSDETDSDENTPYQMLHNYLEQLGIGTDNTLSRLSLLDNYHLYPPSVFIEKITYYLSNKYSLFYFTDEDGFNGPERLLYGAIRKHRSLAFIKSLLERHPHPTINVYKPNDYGKSFLHFAAEEHLLEVTTMFLEMYKKEGINLDLQTKHQGTSPLLSALISRLKHPEESEDLIQIVKILLDSGADPNLTEQLTGATPLYWAIRQGYLNIVKILIEAGANPHLLSNKQGATHLHAALNPFSPHAENESYQLEIIEMLYEMGVDLNAQLLHLAVIRDKPKIVQYFISKKVHLDLKNEDGNPPLFFALKRNRLEITKMLLAAGANPNFQDLEGNTFLHLEIPIMTYNQTEEEIQILKKHLKYLIETVGIDPNIKNNKGETALDYALRFNHPPAIQEVLTRTEQTTNPCRLLF